MRLRLLVALASGGLAAAAACVPSYQFQETADGGADAAADVTMVKPPPPVANDGGNGGDGGDAHPTSTGGDVDAGDAVTPPPPPPPTGALTHLTAGGDDTCFVRDGKVYCFGAMNLYGQLGTAPFDAGFVATPRAIDAQPFGAPDELRLSKPQDGASGFACARASGAVYCWGYAEYGQRGDNGSGAAEDGPTPTLVPFLGQGTVGLATGAYHACALLDSTTDASNVYCWGWDGDDEQGPRDEVGNKFHVVGVPAMKEIAAGGSFTCGIARSTNEIWCWGYSDAWRAGPEVMDGGFPTDAGAFCYSYASCAPRKVALPSGAAAAKDLALGERFACALTESGEVYCWGDDVAGQLGAGVPPSSPCPFAGIGLSDGDCSATPVRTVASGATQITAGFDHGCARLADGTAVCWGDGRAGQLGNGRAAPSFAPANVQDPANPAAALHVDEIAAGATHTCATSGDKLYCWGSATSSADAGTSAVPVRVSL